MTLEFNTIGRFEQWIFVELVALFSRAAGHSFFFFFPTKDRFHVRTYLNRLSKPRHSKTAITVGPRKHLMRPLRTSNGGWPDLFWVHWCAVTDLNWSAIFHFLVYGGTCFCAPLWLQPQPLFFFFNLSPFKTNPSSWCLHKWWPWYCHPVTLKVTVHKGARVPKRCIANTHEKCQAKCHILARDITAVQIYVRSNPRTQKPIFIASPKAWVVVWDNREPFQSKLLLKHFGPGEDE